MLFFTFISDDDNGGAGDVDVGGGSIPYTHKVFLVTARLALISCCVFIFIFIFIFLFYSISSSTAIFSPLSYI